MPPETSRPPSRWPLLLAIVVGLAPLIYSVRHGFYLDDFSWLTRAYRSEGVLQVLTTPWLAGFIRPFGQLLFWSEFQVFGLAPLPYNIFGIALHGLVGGFVYLACRRTSATVGSSAVLTTMFLVGSGHFVKPVLWACSHPILLGTLLTLVAAHFLEPGQRHSGRAVASLAALGAMLTHDLFLLVPLATGLLLLIRGGRSKPGYPTVLAIAGAIYLAFGLSSRSELSIPYAVGPHILTNGLHAAACLAGPFSSVPAMHSALTQLGVGIPPIWIRVSFLTIGGVVVLGFVTAVIRLGLLDSGGRSRGTIFWSLLLGATIAPALLVESAGDWIDPRYLYPASALAMPLLAGVLATARRPRVSEGDRVTGLARRPSVARNEAGAPFGNGNVSGSRPASRNRARLLAAALAWYGLLLLGNLSMQQDAIREGSSERAARRWESLRDVLSEEPR